MSREDNKWVEGTVKHATEAAVLIEVEEGNEVWIPRTLISYGPEEFSKGDEIEIEIPFWLAEERGLAW